MESSGVVIAERSVRRIDVAREKPIFPQIEDKLLQKAELLRTAQGSTLRKINEFISGLPPELRDCAGRAKLRALERWDGKEKFSSVFGGVLPLEILAHHGERLNAIMNPPEARAAA